LASSYSRKHCGKPPSAQHMQPDSSAGRQQCRQTAVQAAVQAAAVAVE
jgi:hypothetical protein